MEFSWNEDQRQLYAQTLQFAREHLKPDATEFDRDAWAQAGAFGLLGLCVPEALGGEGLDALSTAYAMEAFGSGCEDTGFVFSAAAHLFACTMPIADFASASLRESIVPRLASGQWIGANAITEPGAGSDVFALTTRAHEDGDGYRITGQKSYVTNGPVADLFLVYATTNPAFGHMGVTAFAVPRETAGITIGRPFDKTGLSSSPVCPVYFEDARVSKDAIVGRVGQGSTIFRLSMQWERACLFGLYVGVMDRQLARCVEYASSRTQAGRAIGRNQGIGHKLADMKLRLEAARLLLYRACWAFDQGHDAELDICLSKLAISEAAIRSGLDAIQIHGGAGCMTEVGIERTLRDAIPAAIFSGTSEIQRNLIATGLGL